MRYSDPRKYNYISRYSIYRQILDTDTYLESYNQKYISQSDRDQFHVVTNKEENRLDIISNNYYGTPTYWWVIALANELIDPFIVNVGTSVRIPPIDSIFELNGVLYKP